MSKPILNPEALVERCRHMVLVHALVDDLKPAQALRLMRGVWETCPADFPEFAEMLAEELAEGRGVRGACWCMAEMLKDRIGAFDLVHEALHIAAEWTGNAPFVPVRPNYSCTNV